MGLRLRKLHCMLQPRGLSWSQAKLCGVPTPWGPWPILACAIGAAPQQLWGSRPAGDLQAPCEQGKVCKMERSKGVTSGWLGDSPALPVACWWRRPPALLPSAASAPCRNLVWLVLLWARPNPAHSQQLAPGANCCTAVACPATSADQRGSARGEAARPGSVPTMSWLMAHGPETNLAQGRGKGSARCVPAFQRSQEGSREKVRRWPGAFPSTCNSPRSFLAALSLAACQWVAACVSPVVREVKPSPERDILHVGNFLLS